MKQWHELASALAKSRGCGYWGAWADINMARSLYGEGKAYTGINRLITENVSWFTAFNTTDDPQTAYAKL